MRIVRLAALALLVSTPVAGSAADAPHEDGVFCSNCHMGHNAPGGSLTKVEGNFNLCQSCHLGSTSLGFPWGAQDQAVPGTSGRSHRWDAIASAHGATPPNPSSADPHEAALGSRLEGGKLKCSTCHDTHQADLHPVGGRGRQNVSTVTRTGTGTGTLTVVTPVATDATAKQYLVQIVGQGSSTTATFKLSNDNGRSWFRCSSPTAYDYLASTDPANAPTSTDACQAGASVALNDGSKVRVAFSGGANTFRVGDQHRFYVSYPFLRVDNTDARMCVTCHKDRHQSWQNIEGIGPLVGTGQGIVLGTTKFSHPIGHALDANGRGYDRGAPLEPDGSASDSNPANDLRLGTGGIVTCLTCHRVHNAVSNSLSN